MLVDLNVLSEADRRTAEQPEPAPSVAAAPVREAPQTFTLDYDPTRSDGDMLTDAFGREHTYLRISLTERCNLRCRYCMPEEGVDLTPDDQLLTRAEIARLGRLFTEAGVSKIRLTGGEPLLRPGVEDIAADLGKLPDLNTLALTTNGLLLPKKLDRLEAAGITHYNISLDTLRPDRFEEMARRQGFSLVLRAIDEAIARDLQPLKVNCVVMRGVNDDEVNDFVAWTKKKPVEVRFIEYMPFTGNGWDDSQLVPYDELLQRIRQRFPLERCSDGPHDTSKKYHVPGFAGQIGFITSMTDPFCEGCTRLRVTADGNLKVCLFGNAEVSLRDALRDGATDTELRALVSRAVGRKKARHAGMHNLARMENRPMITIGG